MLEVIVVVVDVESVSVLMLLLKLVRNVVEVQVDFTWSVQQAVEVLVVRDVSALFVLELDGTDEVVLVFASLFKFADSGGWVNVEPLLAITRQSDQNASRVHEVLRGDHLVDDVVVVALHEDGPLRQGAYPVKRLLVVIEQHF